MNARGRGRRATYVMTRNGPAPLPRTPFVLEI
jgi:hypothetical protein